MTYTVAITYPVILSSSAYNKMKQGYRLELEPAKIIAKGLSKNEAIRFYDFLSINEYPNKNILDENNLQVNTCTIFDNYKTNIVEDHKGKA